MTKHIIGCGVYSPMRVVYPGCGVYRRSGGVYANGRRIGKMQNNKK